MRQQRCNLKCHLLWSWCCGGLVSGVHQTSAFQAAKHADSKLLNMLRPYNSRDTCPCVRQNRMGGLLFCSQRLDGSACIYFLPCMASIQIGDLVGVSRIKAHSSLVGGFTALEVSLYKPNLLA